MQWRFFEENSSIYIPDGARELLRTRPALGYQLGLQVHYALNEKWQLTSGLQLEQHGYSPIVEESSPLNIERVHFSYLGLPLLARVHMSSNWAISLGMQPSLRLRSAWQTESGWDTHSAADEPSSVWRPVIADARLGLHYQWKKF